MLWTSAAATDRNTEDAVAAAAAAVERGLEGQTPDLLVVFATQHHAERFRDLSGMLRAALPHGHLLGCSAGGVIGGGHEIEGQPALSLVAASLPGVTIEPIRADGIRLPDDDASPRAWYDEIRVDPEPPPKFLLLADPFTFPAQKFLTGLDYAFPLSPKVGGLASGADRPGANALFLEGEVHGRGLVGVAMRGDLRMRIVVAQGCRPIGRPLRVTRGQGNVVAELEGRPALQIVQELAAGLPEHDRELARQSLFLGFEMTRLRADREPDFLIRNIVGLDPRSGSLAIGETVRGGQLVQFHIRDARTSADDLSQHLARFAPAAGQPVPRGSLLFSCVGRGFSLYGQPDHDSAAFHQHFGDVPLGGFFCSGEIGPVAGTTFLHGYTSAFALFSPLQAEEQKGGLAA